MAKKQVRWVRVLDSNWVKIGAAAAVIAVIVAVVALVRGGPDSNQKQETREGQCNVQGDANTVSCTPPSSGAAQTRDEQLLEDAKRFEDKPPTGKGPWPFVVVNTPEGLKVRSTNVARGTQFGGLGDYHVAWAVCQARSDFDPDPGTTSGPVWLKIKWDQQAKSTSFYESDAGSRTTAWIYRGYLAPVGHSGAIPTC